MYFKCWLGARKTVKITKASKHNTNSLKNHLERKFPTQWSLYQVLQACNDPPTPAELDFAQGKQQFDAETAKTYLNKLQKIQGNIKEMLLKQAAAAEVSFSYALSPYRYLTAVFARSLLTRKDSKSS